MTKAGGAFGRLAWISSRLTRDEDGDGMIWPCDLSGRRSLSRGIHTPVPFSRSSFMSFDGESKYNSISSRRGSAFSSAPRRLGPHAHDLALDELDPVATQIFSS